MSQEKTVLEVIAATVEEATAKGLAQLGLPADAVDVEILDQGSRGFLGLGGRQARIRLVIKDQLEGTTDVVEAPAHHEWVEPVGEDIAGLAQGEADEETAETAREVVAELLEKMQVQANVSVRLVPPADEKDRSLVLVEVEGNDLSILIGRRSETLNALQYITSLIVSKQAGRWVPLMIDIQGCRGRRERQLRVMARKMAEQAINTGRRQVLEPMPANERRIIHLELRNHPLVTTESTGEEPNRKVTIVLKQTQSS